MYSWETKPQQVYNDEIIEVVDADIVVVGAGISGMPAAVKASELGANVHILEKGASYGSTRMGTAALGSRAQKEAGIELDLDETLGKFWGYSQGNGAVLPLQSLWLHRSGEFMDWFTDIVEKYGFPVKARGFLPGFSNPAIFFNSFSLFHTIGDPSPFEGGNPDWMGALEQEAKKNGAAFHYKTRAYQLIREDGEHGRVSGVIATDENGRYVRYNATKGVILAAGDFMRDREMVEKYCPIALDCTYDMSNIHNTGDMHKAGMWIGAALQDCTAIDIFPGENVKCKEFRPADKLPHFMGVSWSPAYAGLPMFYVDIEGRRCMNEEIQFMEGGTAINRMFGHHVWSIWDGTWTGKVPGFPELTPFSLNTPEQLEIDLKEGLTVKADTIDELILKIGVDPETFKASLEHYNDLCKSGHDDDCLKDPAWLATVDTPPYYASSLGSAVCGTRGGFRIDTNINVLDNDGKPIPGLYAAGNNSGSFYGAVYPGVITGSGVGHGQCFGYLAAINCFEQN